MARLVITSNGFGERVLDLKLGLNRLGRSPDNDFCIEHPSVSAFHCEIQLSADHVTVRDCSSTNGTFVSGEAVEEARLQSGQKLCLGEVELMVASTEVVIAIPKFDVPRPSPPVVLSDGSIVCPRHPHARATYQCRNCRELLCDACVHQLRRRGGRPHKLCPLCSHECDRLAEGKKKRRSLLELFQKTVKLPLLAGKKRRK